MLRKINNYLYVRCDIKQYEKNLYHVLIFIRICLVFECTRNYMLCVYADYVVFGLRHYTQFSFVVLLLLRLFSPTFVLLLNVVLEAVSSYSLTQLRLSATDASKGVRTVSELKANFLSFI